ncbi:hypothetical protein ACPUD5_26430, partial [Escherichia coli]|uniref:hypothetical protein n=1 Tax=Escherichia coli TaxID=562 RepID=UPI003CC59953
MSFRNSSMLSFGLRRSGSALQRTCTLAQRALDQILRFADGVHDATIHLAALCGTLQLHVAQHRSH